ncbi:MAG: hypothetical protein U0559_09295 [Anaerolineae bacterium]
MPRAASQTDRDRAVVAEEPGFTSDAPDVPTLEDRYYLVSYWLGERWLSLRIGASSRRRRRWSAAHCAAPVFIRRDWARLRADAARYFTIEPASQAWWEASKLHGASPIVRPDEYEIIKRRIFDRALK